MRQHITVKASDLRKGDLMRLGFGTNYVLISSATVVPGWVDLTTYSGDNPRLDGPIFSRTLGEDIELSARDLGPNDRIGD